MRLLDKCSFFILGFVVAKDSTKRQGESRVLFCFLKMFIMSTLFFMLKTVAAIVVLFPMASKDSSVLRKTFM